MVHDKINYNIENRAVPVKHYLLRLLISANTGSTMLYVDKIGRQCRWFNHADKRYVITNGNQLAIQNDLLEVYQKR